MALRWKKEEAAGGLARVCQGPRGAHLRLDGENVASVRYSRGDRYWYYYIYSPLPRYMSTEHGESFTELSEAKSACKQYVQRLIKSGALEQEKIRTLKAKVKRLRGVVKEREQALGEAQSELQATESQLFELISRDST